MVAKCCGAGRHNTGIPVRHRVAPRSEFCLCHETSTISSSTHSSILPAATKHVPVPMTLFSSFIIDPVVRQARRFSGTTQPAVVTGLDGQALTLSQLSHVNRSSPRSDASPHNEEDAVRTAQSDEAAAVTEDGISFRRPQSAIPEDRAVLHDIIVPHVPAPSLSRRATAPIAIADTQMSSNPARTVASRLRELDVDSSLSTTSASTSTSTRSPATGPRNNASTMSESLPADDGMRHLRARIHQIRELNISDGDKARMMHGLMTERYNHLRPTSASSFTSHERPFTPTSSTSIFSDAHVGSPQSSASEALDPENPYNLRPGDTEPTYRSLPAHVNPDAPGDEEEGDFDDEVAFGCQHYRRNVKVQCFECRRWHTCRHCHDAVEDHNLNRVMTKNMLCMACGTPQRAAEYCVKCELQAACYYCDVCKLWDNNSNKKIYHCFDCGICRRGEGLGKDFIHCKARLTLFASRLKLILDRIATSA